MPKKSDSLEEIQGSNENVVDEESLREDARALLERCRHYVIKGGRYLNQDQEKVFTVKISKDTPLRISHHNAETNLDEEKIALYKKAEPFDCDLLVLTKLVKRAIQEGPEGMKASFFEDSGKPRAKRPLKVDVLDIRIASNSALARSKYFVDPKRLPTLN